MKWCIIESGQYDDEKVLPLVGVKNSIEKLNTTIVNSLNINKSDILTISNETRDTVIYNIQEFIEKVDTREVFVFYFCGHGVKIGDELYLYVRNTKYSAQKLLSIKYTDIKEIISSYKIKSSIVILDCCHSGAAAKMGVKGLPESNIDNVYEKEGGVVLCSCGANQRSLQVCIEGKSYAAFTYCFAEALAKGIDSKREKITLKEIIDKVRPLYSKLTGAELQFLSKQGFDSDKLIPNAHYLREIGSKKKQKLSSIREKIRTRIKPIKLLLVKTTINYPTRDNDFGIPLGLWVLKNYLVLSMPNVEVEIYDERLEQKREGQISDFAEIIEGFDVVGISVCSCEVPMAIEKFKIAHQCGKITVAGGIFTYSNEKYLLEYDCIDYIIPGVGTKPMKDLLSSLMMMGDRKEHVHIDHVYTVGHDTSIWVANTLPGMEFHTWDEILERYKGYLTRDDLSKIDISTSRGCNKECNFCSVRREAGQPILSRNCRYIIDEIDYLYSKGIRYFSIKDEDFYLHGSDKVEKILEHCKQYNDIHFKIRMRLDSWLGDDKPDYEKLRKWGIDEIQYGVESPQNEILKVLHKGINIEYKVLEQIFKEHIENEITVNASLILAASTLEDENYYQKLTDFVDKFSKSGFFKPYLNFWTPHPFNSRIAVADHNVVTSDINYYTHKIPVSYPIGIKNPARELILKTYDQIVDITQSELFNPPIPDKAKNNFIIGNVINNGEIMRY